MNQRGKVIHLIKEAKQAYYTDKLSDDSLQTVFQCVGELMHDKNKVLPNHDSKKQLADQFVHFFLSKVCKIYDEIQLSSKKDTSPNSPYIYDIPTEHTFQEFDSVSHAQLLVMISKTKSKSCSLDPIPTWLLKDKVVIDAVIPLLCNIVNQSLKEGVVPLSIKCALVSPVPKKQNMDANVLANYRPVSNIPYLRKTY